MALIIPIFLGLFITLTSSLQAAVHTDTHTYILSEREHKVLSIDRRTGEEKVISVPMYPKSMLIYGGLGYLLHGHSNKITVLDLKSNTATRIILVGEDPQSMVIHGDLGYVVDNYLGIVSVLDLKSNKVTKTIPVGEDPQSMVIHGDLGYVISDDVSVLNLKTNTVIKTKPVEEDPQSMVIHGDLGYLVDGHSHRVLVLDFLTHTVINTISVGCFPTSLVIHGDLGYVVNSNSNNVSVLDLKSNTVTKTIPLKGFHTSMAIHENLGVVSGISDDISIIDLSTHKVIAILKNPNAWNVDFSDTHIYLGVTKIGPLYPTLASLQRMKEEKRFGEFVKMNPKAFDVGEVKPREYPVEENEFDQLPPYVLAQEIFWDLATGKPRIDPVDILATLITMKYPQKFLQTEAGKWLRPQLHVAFFQVVWLGQTEKAQVLLRYFIQLGDPVITKLMKTRNAKGSVDEIEEDSTSTSSTSTHSKKRKTV